LEDNINTDLKEIGWEDVDWIDLTQGRDQWSEHDSSEPSSSIAGSLSAPQERFRFMELIEHTPQTKSIQIFALMDIPDINIHTERSFSVKKDNMALFS
jgi:hypothetical protein